jgi:hypothetical protein
MEQSKQEKVFNLLTLGKQRNTPHVFLKQEENPRSKVELKK